MALSTNLSASQKLKSKAQKFFVLPFAFLLVPASTVAQIVPDSSLPVNSIVSPEGNTNVITGGTRAGGNLFHSFGEFSIPTNGTAFFNNALDIQNIITRVTGGSISRIDGLLRANGIANFFLLNPNGIIFGPNARLDINGSFLASTARSLKFADGSELGTSAAQTPPLLTVSVPVGLQFGQTTGSIVVEGKGQPGSGRVNSFESKFNPLEVKPGNTLTLVGGEVRLDGGILQAPGGRVELGAIAQGTVEINTDRSLTFPSETERADVFFTKGAAINVIGSGGGSITINARNLDISANTLLTNGIESGKGNIGTKVGDITLNATGSIAIESSRIENNVNFDTAADGGNINIFARSLSLDNAQVDAGNLGQGNAGNIFVQVDDFVSLANESSIASNAYNDEQNSGGIAGLVSIKAGNSIAIDNSTISARNFGTGNAGFISIKAGDTIAIANNSTISSDAYSLNNTDTEPKNNGSVSGGAAGYIFISAKNIAMDKSNITAETFSGLGTSDTKEKQPGAIYMFADSISLSDETQLSTNTFGTGAGGNIIIDSHSLSITGGSRLEATTSGAGNAGDINITANSVSLTDRAKLQTNSTGTGNAGYVFIEAGDTIDIDRAKLQTNSTGTGNAGYVSIKAGDTIAIANNSTISSDAYSLNNTDTAPKNNGSVSGGAAGYIFISAKNIAIDKSQITADTFSELGTSKPPENQPGTIYMSADSISLSDETQLSTNTFGTGTGGDITINSRSLSVTGGSRLEATTSGTGKAGNVVIKAESFALTDGSTLDAGTFGDGDAGSINIDVDGSVEIAGKNTRIYSDPQKADGNGGTINIKARSLSLTDGAALETSTSGAGKAGNVLIEVPNGDVFFLQNAKITSNSFGTGAAGDIQITARNLQLDNRSKIAAETELSGKGGNIILQVEELLLLRRDSNITTSAATGEGPGDGGYITINASNLVGLANGDIFANANKGKGGKIQIYATGVFGIARREIRNDTTSDITATSELDPSLNGEVTINTPDVDPSQGLVELSVQTVDTENQVAKSCARRNSNQFTVTGRGGLPPSPNNYLNSEGVWVDLRTSQPAQENSPSPSRNSQFSRPDRIVEAQGWVRTADGKIILTAQTPDVTPHSPPLTTPGCN